MKISHLAIDRPVFTLVIAISTVVFGLIGYLSMGVDLFPEVEMPVVTISTTLEGASPEVVETAVTTILEDEIATLDRVESITSQSTFGSSTVIVEFALEKDIDIAVQEVRDRVAAAQRRLPEEIDPPLIQKINIADQPIMWLAASGEGDYWAMARWVDQVAEDRLVQVEGVGSVTLGAFRNRAYRIWIDPLALAARRLDALDVVAALQAQHVELPAGRAEGPRREVALRVFGEFDSAEELASLILRGGERPVRLRDVARVEAGLEEATSLARFNGHPAVGMGVRKQSGANTVEVAERVKAFLPELQAAAPPGVALGIAFDSSRFIRNSITGVQFDVVFGAVLTMLVVYLFLRSGRATLITALAIPTSLIATFALMSAAGFTMNNLTMLGLSLAVGMVIDDAIVVIENVYRHLEEGKAPREAARAAMSEIGFAVIVTTVSLIAVFVPIAYMRGLIGRFFFQFGLTVSFAMAVSTLIALTLSPMLGARLLRRGDEGRQMRQRWFLLLVAAGALLAFLFVRQLLGDWRPAALLAVALAVFGAARAPFEPVYQRLERLYRRALPLFLRHRLKTLAAAAALFAGGLALAASPVVGKEFARQADEGRFLVRYQAPLGTSLETTDRLADGVDAALAQYPEIRSRFVATGFGGGGAPQPHVGIAFINMVPSLERERSQQEVMAALRAELNRIPGLVVFVDSINPMGGGQRTTDVQYVLRGPDLATLARVGEDVVDRLEDAGGFVGVDSDLDLERPEARIRIDRERAELLGVSARRITDTINLLMGGADVAFFKEEGERYDVRVRAERAYNLRPEDVLPLPIRTASGAVIPLDNVVRVEESVGPNVIPRYDRQRAATIYANLAGKPLGEALQDMQRVLGEVLPPGGLYSAKAAGTSKNFQEAALYLGLALGLSALIVYLVLAAQFESFVHPFTILMGLPLAMAGVFVALAASGLSLDIFSAIGVIMLVGIAAKNGILLIDYTQQLRDQGLPRDEALERAGPVRLRPILMTAVTTASGMIPVALAFSEGGESRASMGAAVIGGMLTSAPLTLVVVPAVYTLMDDLVAWGRAHAQGLGRSASAGGALAIGVLVGSFLFTGDLTLAALGALAAGGVLSLLGVVGVAAHARWRAGRAGA